MFLLKICSVRRIGVLGLAWIVIAPQLIRPQTVGSASRTIHVNLEQYGWRRLPPPRRHESWPTEAKLMRVDSTGRVLVGYPAREGNELAIRGNPRLLFHILRFTSDGKLDLSVSLPTDNIPHNAI